MAKKIYHLKDIDFHHFCDYLKKEILTTSASASLEEEHYIEEDDFQIAIFAFERYSMTGNNRLSLSVTIVVHDHLGEIIGISAGGSTGVILKVNTFGENAFLSKLNKAIEKYKENI